jgi:hypothetical protein
LEEIRNRKDVLKKNSKDRAITEAADALADLNFMLIYGIGNYKFEGISGKTARSFRENVRREFIRNLQEKNGDFKDAISKLIEEIKNNKTEFIKLYKVRRQTILKRLILERRERKKYYGKRPIP